MVIRPSCASCKFRSPQRISDLTIWDCFNIYKLDKRFPEDAGTTRMLVHTEKGMELLRKISRQLHIKEIPFDDAVEGVREMCESPVLHERRSAFFRDNEKMEMGELLNRYFPVTWKVKLKRNVRLAMNKCGIDKTVKHLLKKG
jgi:hypothetical protein